MNVFESKREIYHNGPYPYFRGNGPDLLLICKQ